MWLHLEIYGSQGTPRQIVHIKDCETSALQNRSVGILLITTFLNISGAGSEEHDSITDNLSTGGKGGLSTGGQKEHDVEADGTTMELKDVKDEGDSGDVMSLVSVEGLELSLFPL